MQTDVLNDETRPADMPPQARMAAIRRLTKAANEAAVSAGRIHADADQMRHDDPAMRNALNAVDAMWTVHDQLVTELLECLHQAEAAGDLAVCEAALG